MSKTTNPEIIRVPQTPTVKVEIKPTRPTPEQARAELQEMAVRVAQKIKREERVWQR